MEGYEVTPISLSGVKDAAAITAMVVGKDGNCKSLDIHLTDFFCPAIMAADKCVLLQAHKMASAILWGPERVCWFKSSPQHFLARL